MKNWRNMSIEEKKEWAREKIRQEREATGLSPAQFPTLLYVKPPDPLITNHTAELFSFREQTFRQMDAATKEADLEKFQ